MAARLGNAIFWIGKSIAVLSLLFGVMVVLGALVTGRETATEIVGTIVICTALAVISYFVGRAARYVLVGV